MDIVKNIMLLSGCLILVISLRPVRQLILPLPIGKIRSQWNILQYLIGLFICGYLVYTYLFWNRFLGVADLIVPVIFFFGAVFVLLVCQLSLSTTKDLLRIYSLERENMTDPLMGIYNRRYFDRRLHEEFARSVRYRQPLSLIMADIDHFKAVNDKWGHQTGDRVLKSLAELLSGAVRESDVVCRYGGEELAIILPHTSGDASMILAERLRAQVAQLEIAVVEGSGLSEQLVRITVSLGVSELMPQMETTDMFVMQADKALYSAKLSGRNCVVACKELSDSDRC